MERELVRWLCQRIPAHPRLLVGPGDDAAIVRPAPGHELVITSDMLMDGTDFVLGRDDPARIGHKALAVNLSDLAAMAAQPLAAVVSLALPQAGGLELARQLYEGILPLASQLDCPIAGGDTNAWRQGLVISVTAFGEVPEGRRWRRSGAQPGDAILVTGSFGGSILRKHFAFQPRVREALRLADACKVHAAIDVSDGVSLDLARLCEASGCGAMLDLAAIPIADDAHELAKSDGRSPLEHALGDGEDFELLLAVAAEDANRLISSWGGECPLRQIGCFTERPGLVSRSASGELAPLTPRGYEHRLE